MIEMSVEFVRVSMQNYNRVVILKEKESERYLLIWISKLPQNSNGKFQIGIQEITVSVE